MSKTELHKQVLDALKFRHACKIFDNTRIIPEDDFNLILEAGRLSPSAFGWEPWSFVVLQNQNLRNGLIPFCWGAKRQAPTASHFVLVLARRPCATIFNSDYIKDMMQRIQKLDPAKQAEKQELYENFQKYEFKLLDSERNLYDYASKQCYIAMANMMLAAAFIGIDSCAMEGFDIEKTENYLVEKGVFDPKQFGLTSMIAFGYRPQGKANPPKARHEMSEIVSWVE